MPNFVTPSFDSGFLTSTFSQSRFYHSSDKRDTFRQPQHLLLRLQLLLDPLPSIRAASSRIAAPQAAFLFFASRAPLSLPRGADKQAS